MWWIDEDPVSERRVLGEHTEEVLAENGFTAGDSRTARCVWPEAFGLLTREIQGNLLTVSERGRIRRRRRPWTGSTTQGLT